MESCRIKQRQIDVILIDQQHDFGATKYDPFGAPQPEFLDHLKVSDARSLTNLPADQLVIDHPVDHFPIVVLGDEHFEPEFALKSVAIERLFHGERRAKHGQRA